jgi:predicted nucleic acid-binding protein
MVLEAAVNGQADAIVTFNVHDFRGSAEGFGIKVLTPGEAVRFLEGQS